MTKIYKPRHKSTPERRARKRFLRENRKNKGVSTEAKRQAYNSQVREARDLTGLEDNSLALLTAGLMSIR